MKVVKTKSQILVSFEPNDWACGRAPAVINEIKAEIPRKAWTYNEVAPRVWAVNLLFEEAFSAIQKRHLADHIDQRQHALFNLNQKSLFDAVSEEAAA